MIFSSAALGLLLLMPQGDAQARSVHEAWVQRQGTLQAVTGKMVMQWSVAGREPDEWEFQLAKPDKFRVAGKNQAWISNGEKAHMLSPGEKSFSEWKAGGRAPLMNGFENFFGPAPDTAKPTDFRIEEFEGKKVAVAEFKPRKDISIQTLLDLDTKQPIGWRQVMADSKLTAKYVDLNLNATITDQSVFALPEGYSPRKAPDFYASLLKVGAEAPDFTLKKSDGGETSLKKELKGKKAVLLNFWFYG